MDLVLASVGQIHQNGQWNDTLMGEFAKSQDSVEVMDRHY